MVKTKTAVSLALGALMISAGVFVSSSVAGQRQRTRTNAATPADVSSYVPASDAIALVNVKRMLNETMPSILGSDPAKLSQANAEVDKFKARTGVDLRTFDRVTVAMQYVYPAPNSTRLETVAIAHGTFDGKAITASARAAANGKFREEKYRGS